jgi:anthranilate synthase component 1
MHFYPQQDVFCRGLEAGKPQLVWTKLVTDLESPVTMMKKLEATHQAAFFLESVAQGQSRGRYSLIALDPDLVWRCFGSKAEISSGSFEDEGFSPCAEASLPALKSLIRSSLLDIPQELPPMAAGLIGFMGYDMVKQVEVIPHNNPDSIGIPDGLFMRPRMSIVHDAVDGVTYLITPIWDCDQSAEAAYQQACDYIRKIVELLRQATPSHWVSIDRPQGDLLDFQSNLTQDEYEAIVRRAKEYIAAGEIFQVVAAQRFTAEFNASPFALYRALRYTNPSPFLFYLKMGDFSLIGSSPEILVRLREGKVTIRPIAGTRPRGATMQADEALAEELLADPKERAEHQMLLDLGRNDVGRVARPGTVTVTEQMIIERYSHVMHIVSNVEGELADGFDAVDALMAGFPAGTVSGAPKIRAMEIIDELEPESRSFYAGCVGYFSANGEMDSCITLRTACVKDGKLYVQAGGGLVADSDPTAEYQESCNKARAVMAAASLADQFEST